MKLYGYSNKLLIKLIAPALSQTVDCFPSNCETLWENHLVPHVTKYLESADDGWQIWLETKVAYKSVLRNWTQRLFYQAKNTEYMLNVKGGS